MAARKPTNTEVSIQEFHFDEGQVTCHVIGRTPLYFNRMAEKAKRELLLPRGRKTAADKARSLKHNPVEEFRASLYQHKDHGRIVRPTRLCLPSPCFKASLLVAALETPAAKKTQIGRLVWVSGQKVDVWGIPRLKMDVVRSADMNKTPDIRTRALLAEWSATVTVNFASPTIVAQDIATLMSVAGLVSGIGDYRQEKGKGNYGQFQLVDEQDEQLLRIRSEGGMKQQDKAIKAAEPFDADTEELFTWYAEEIQKRGRDAA